MKPVIAIHGGAGVMRRDKPGEQQRAVLKRALEAAYEQRNALDAVTAAVVILEDSPLFNAGRGSCFNADGEIEMDASIGWALFPTDGATPEELLARADGQMYATKRETGEIATNASPSGRSGESPTEPRI